MAILIRNGFVYMEKTARRADLLITGDKIHTVDEYLTTPPHCQIVDATGLAVLPGFIDFHVHLGGRIGGFDLADDFRGGSQAAISSGITTLLSFITQPPGESLTQALHRGVEQAAGQSHCDFAFHLTPTRFDAGDYEEIRRLADQGWRSYKFYTTYREAGLYLDYQRLASIFDQLAGTPARFLIHAEDEPLLDKLRQHAADPANPLNHARSRPPRSEIEAIRQVLKLVTRTGCPVHFVHVSTPRGAKLVQAARAALPVSAETCPQYLFLDDTSLAGPAGHRFICSPPLRRPRQRKELAKLVLDGFFDLIATDHCAFRCQDKDHAPDDFRQTPNGLPGLGALVPLTYELLAGGGQPVLPALIRLLAEGPARRAGLYPLKGVIAPGADADLVLLDVNGPERPVRSSLAPVYDPYEGRRTRLRVARVYRRGQEVCRDGELLDTGTPGGRCLWPL